MKVRENNEAVDCRSLEKIAADYPQGKVKVQLPLQQMLYVTRVFTM